MKKNSLILTLFSLFTLHFSLFTDAQVITFDSTSEWSVLKRHISTLASDKLEGRETGTKGEQGAANYIISQFKNIGLKPLGTKKYIQPFSYNEGAIYSKNSEVKTDGKSWQSSTDWFAIPYSGNGIVTGAFVKVGAGIIAPTLNYNDYKGKSDLAGKIFIIEWALPGGLESAKFANFMDTKVRIDSAIAKGASAIIFVNHDKTAEDAKEDFSNKYKALSIPIVYAKPSLIAALDSIKNPEIMVSVELIHQKHEGHNVIGYIDNHAANTVVIGGHYDHLGWGGGGSLYRGVPAIHNGADDNASGTAAVIEIARYLQHSTLKNNNYLFIAFSGEEKGLLGSNSFVKNPTVPLANITYMINMDMVGRLKSPEKTLAIYGVGTSPVWHPVVDKINIDSVKIKTLESGVGPSDQTSFYLKDIPVLHFFSGSHSDYHKPSDDEDKINYAGEISIIKIILTVIEQMDDKPKLTFTKTKEDSTGSASRYKLTMGVIPDYTFEGDGMRIDGVSDGKPASKAGLKTGDVVTQMGDFKVNDMMSYMKSLGNFKKGDTITVKFKRDKEMMETKVTFQ